MVTEVLTGALRIPSGLQVNTSKALFRVRSYQLPVMPPKLSGHPKSVPMVCRISL